MWDQNYATAEIHKVFEGVHLGKEQTLLDITQKQKKTKTTDEIRWNNQSSHQRIEEANYRLSKLSVNPSSHKGCVMKIHEELQLHRKKGKKAETLIARWARYPGMNKSPQKRIREWAEEHVKKCSTSLWGDASQNHNVILLQVEGPTPKDGAYSQEAETGGSQVWTTFVEGDMARPCLKQILKKDRWAATAEISASLSAVSGGQIQLSIGFETFANISNQNLKESAENSTRQEQDFPSVQHVPRQTPSWFIEQANQFKTTEMKPENESEHPAGLLPGRLVALTDLVQPSLRCHCQSAMVHNVPSPNYLVEFGKTVQSLHSPNRVPCRL